MSESKQKRKLYFITFNGLGGRFAKGAYVVATSADAAYETVRRWLDKKNFGFVADRAFKSIQLLAEDNLYTNLDMILFFQSGIDGENV